MIDYGPDCNGFIFLYNFRKYITASIFSVFCVFPMLFVTVGIKQHSAMKTNFPDKHIIIPEEAVLSVLKGAVLFGHKPDYIASRVMRVSYGTDVTVLFDPDSRFLLPAFSVHP
jgi:hypothetical protein